MAIPIIIPRLGWNMEEGVFLGWLKQDGEPIRAGETLFRLESEKAAEDIECHDGGIVRIAPKGPKEGDVVPVGAVIGYLLLAGEEFQIAEFKLPIESMPAAPVPAASGPTTMGSFQPAYILARLMPPFRRVRQAHRRQAQGPERSRRATKMESTALQQNRRNHERNEPILAYSICRLVRAADI